MDILGTCNGILGMQSLLDGLNSLNFLDSMTSNGERITASGQLKRTIGRLQNATHGESARGFESA